MFTLKHDKQSLRSLAQIFVPSNFKKIVSNRDYSYTTNRVRKHLEFNNNGESIAYSDLLIGIYSVLKRKYKTEYIYKNTLLNKLLLGKYSLNTTSVLNEFKLGSSIADFVLLNGEAQIFEIKSEFDSLDKLNKQVSDYCGFADKVYVVTNTKHLDHLLQSKIHQNIGIVEFTRKDTLKEIRPAIPTNDYFDHTLIFKALRKNEYLEILNIEFGYTPDVPNTQIFKKCLSLAKNIDILRFQKLAVNKLKERTLNCPELLKSDQTPLVIKHLCYSLNFNENEYAELFRFLNKQI